MENFITNSTQELVAQTMIAISNAKNATEVADAATDPTVAPQAEAAAYETARIVAGLVSQLNSRASDKRTTSQNLSEIAVAIKASRAIRDAGQTVARYARLRSERTEALKFTRRAEAPRTQMQPAAAAKKKVVVFTRRAQKLPKG